MTVTLPDELVRRLRMGEVALFLGAGASRGSKDKSGREMPQAQGLSDYLAKTLLTNDYVGKPLAYVGQTAIEYAGVDAVQRTVKELIEPMEPDVHHLKIPGFRWRLIATTNYDLLIEKSYERQIAARLQNLIPWIRNTDVIDSSIQDYSKLLYLKLHGCVNHIGDPSVPLILSPEQFNDHRNNRGNLFDYFRLIASEMPVVWAGFGLMDQDILQILQEIERQYGDLKSSHYIIDPSMDEIRASIFRRRNLHLISCGFSDFIEACDSQIPTTARNISGVIRSPHPIEIRLTKPYDSVNMLSQLLETECEHVRPDMPLVQEDPNIFYQGLCRNFTPMQLDWDVKRNVATKLLNSLESEQARVEMRVLRAPAGLGKTVALRRMAWDLASKGHLCLYLRESGRVDTSAIENLLHSIDERLYVFIDNAPKHSNDIEFLIRRIRQTNRSLTVITTSRVNEWNMFCENLDGLLKQDDYFEIYNLSEHEIDGLLAKLDIHNALGDLKNKSDVERKKFFMGFANRQILVALFEATHGQPLQRIILHEYMGIGSPEARKLYRGVALLHRLGIAVRADLIKKIYKIPYEEFGERFYRPLEKVVFAERDYSGFKYRTRHPEIARMLFDQAYSDPTERLREVINTLKALNTSFESDSQAFSALINHRKVGEYFSDNLSDVDSLYSEALKIGERQEVLRQWGLYELRRGNLDRSEEILLEAQKDNDSDPYTIHAIAELRFKQAEFSKDEQQFENYAEHAQILLESLVPKPRHRPVALHTQIKLDLLRLRRFVSAGNQDEEVRVFTSLERKLHRAQRDYPGDERFIKLESDANRIVKNDYKALLKLEEAHRANKDQVHIIRQLFKIYTSRGETEKAEALLKDSLSRLPDSRELNYLQFEALKGKADPYQLLNLLNRSVVEGDGNRERLFWLSRYAHQYGNSRERKLSLERFERLRDQIGTWGDAGRVRDYAKEGDNLVTYTGVIEGKLKDILWVKRDIDSELVFAHRSQTSADAWEELANGDRVRFSIGYRFAGPIATAITLI